jgi:hypothetical protein
MGKLRNVCSILVRKFKGRDRVVGVVNIDLMMDLQKYDKFFFFFLISELKTGWGVAVESCTNLIIFHVGIRGN